ncbi:serine protease easter-like [Eurosta solidaginis]|uniref:serine protease easter-like n=1 Tax=Eurosta solidaginis TaxID=178769 RepID=UPI003530D2CC
MGLFLKIMNFLEIRVALVVYILFFLGKVTGDTNSEACQTPDRTTGDCRSIQSCSTLYSLAIKPNLMEDEIQFLKNSQCGWDNKKPLVCCPRPVPRLRAQFSLEQLHDNPVNTCETPDGKQGKCISVQKCDSLLPLIKASISPTELNFLRRSKCGNGFAQVCCPNTSVNGGGEFPTPPHCGYVSLTKRIFGGTATDIDEFPWTALIKYFKGNNIVGYHCGGSLINERYVLTAAHCVSKRVLPENWALIGVRLGEWNQETEIDCQIDSRGNSLCAGPHVDVDVEEQICHPIYNVRTQSNDIALLRLKEKIVFNDFIQPICLPFVTYFQLDNFENATMDIAGWGATEASTSSKTKLKALVRVQNFDQCQSKYRSYARVTLSDNQICAGGEKSIDTCRGDSGGPLMFPQKYNGLDSYFLVGVVSFGPSPCGQVGFPGVYTRVASFLEWIQNTTR